MVKNRKQRKPEKVRLFTVDDLKRIELAIAAAETMTAGECVVIAVHSSGEYRWVRWVWAALGWVASTAVLWAFERRTSFPLPLVEVFLYQLAGAAAASLLPFWDPIVRLTLPAHWAARQVHRESLANFLAAGLHETRDRTGVLIYLSEVERRVQILADRGIHEVAGRDYWQAQVDLMLRRIREGRATDGVCEAIEEIGKKLAAHFPPRADDTDELSNQVRLGDQADRLEE